MRVRGNAELRLELGDRVRREGSASRLHSRAFAQRVGCGQELLPARRTRRGSRYARETSRFVAFSSLIGMNGIARRKRRKRNRKKEIVPTRIETSTADGR